MDTPSLTGAYRFVITPGDRTIMDVRCTLFARKGAERPAKIGLGALTSMIPTVFCSGTMRNTGSGAL